MAAKVNWHSIDMKQNYVTVTLCTIQYEMLF